MTDIEHAKKYAEDSISLAISMYNPKAEMIAEYACLYGLTYKNDEIDKLKKENEQLQNNNKRIRDLIEAERQRQEECNDVHLRQIATLEKENKQLKQQIEKMKKDVEELKLGSEDVEMFLRTDELLRSWELAE